MFLTTGNIIGLMSKIVTWIESHPQTVDLIKAVLVTLIAGGYVTKLFSILLEPYFEERKKRNEASIVFYPRLKHDILLLKEALDNHDRLSPGNKNIYKIQIKKDCWYQIDDDSFIYPSDEELDLYKQYASSIKCLIQQSTVNVPPKTINKKVWFDKQHTLLSFCDFILGANKDGGNLDYTISLRSTFQDKCNKVIEMVDFYSKNL